MSKKILFVTGSLGLGHYTRDLAIASALHQLAPEVELSWLAYETVATLLEDSGEQVLPETRQLVDVNAFAEEAAKPGFHLSLPDYLTRTGRGWTENAEIFRKINEKYEFDLIVGDEAYELVLALLQGELLIKPTFLSKPRN